MTPRQSHYGGAADAELIRASRDDPAAFEELFERHALALRKSLLAETHDVAAANDLLAETFARAWLSSSRFRGRHAQSGRAWLFGIARNLALHHHRHGRVETSARKRLQVMVETTDDGGIESSIDRIDAQTMLPAAREALRTLDDDQRLAIGYRVVGDLTYSEIATRLECEPTTARTRVHRGLRSLRAAIEKEPGK